MRRGGLSGNKGSGGEEGKRGAGEGASDEVGTTGLTKTSLDRKDLCQFSRMDTALSLVYVSSAQVCRRVSVS